LIWGNKKYVTDKIVADHSLHTVKKELAELVWGDEGVEKRWDRFRSKIKAMSLLIVGRVSCLMLQA